MTTDYLTRLKYLGLISRIKRLNDKTLADGRKLYSYINIGIGPNWFLIFRILIEKGESSISEIATLLKFAHPSVITIVKKMEKAGYLDLQVSKTDKRRQIITLSKKAIEELPEMKKTWIACEKAVESLFEDDVFINEWTKMEKALNNESFFDRVLNHLDRDNINISSFSSKDSKSFDLLNQEWLRRYFDIEPIDKVVLKNPKLYIINKGGHIFMSTYRDKTVGTVALLPINDHEIELCRMAVSLKYQGKGIGTKLLDSAIAMARKHSYSSIILYSNTILSSAIHLYKKNGFVEESLEKNVIYNRANIKMRLKLTK